MTEFSYDYFNVVTKCNGMRKAIAAELLAACGGEQPKEAFGRLGHMPAKPRAERWTMKAKNAEHVLVSCCMPQDDLVAFKAGLGKLSAAWSAIETTEEFTFETLQDAPPFVQMCAQMAADAPRSSSQAKLWIALSRRMMLVPQITAHLQMEVSVNKYILEHGFAYYRSGKFKGFFQRTLAWWIFFKHLPRIAKLRTEEGSREALPEMWLVIDALPTEAMRSDTAELVVHAGSEAFTKAAKHFVFAFEAPYIIPIVTTEACSQMSACAILELLCNDPNTDLAVIPQHIIDQFKRPLTSGDVSAMFHASHTGGCPRKSPTCRCKGSGIRHQLMDWLVLALPQALQELADIANGCPFVPPIADDPTERDEQRRTSFRLASPALDLIFEKNIMARRRLRYTPRSPSAWDAPSRTCLRCRARTRTT